MKKRGLLLLISMLLFTFAQASLWFTAPLTLNHSLLCFRSAVKLKEVPNTVTLKISLNSHYRLYINGKWVAQSLTATPILIYKDNYTIQSYLKKGVNTFAIEAWNDSIISLNSNIEFSLDTKCEALFSLLKIENWKYTDNKHDSQNISSAWMNAKFDDSKWNTPLTMEQKQTVSDRILPNFIIENEPIGKIIENSNFNSASFNFGKKISGTIAPNTTARILIDKGSISAGFPELKISGGSETTIRFLYIEPQCQPSPKLSESLGSNTLSDTYISNGEKKQRYVPLQRRCFRYLVLEVTTKSQKATIDQLTFVPWSYATDDLFFLKTDNLGLIKVSLMWTKQIKLFTSENYLDNPYQNTVLSTENSINQSINALLLTGDDKLMRHFIQQYEILFNSNKNSNVEYHDLQWVSFINTFYHYTADTAFIHPFLPFILKILDNQVQHIDRQSALYSASYLPSNLKNKEVQASLNFSMILNDVAKLLDMYRLHTKAAEYQQLSVSIKQSIMANYRVGTSDLFYDDANKQLVSQYTASLALLAGLVRSDMKSVVAQQIINDSTLIAASSAQQLTLHRVLSEAGNKQYIDKEINKQIKPLPNANCLKSISNLSFNFGIDLVEHIIGVTPYASGYKEVCIEPNLLSINKIEAQVPTPSGTIFVELKKNFKKNKLKGSINLPEGTKGFFIWNGKRYPLTEADNNIDYELVKPNETAK